MKSILVTLRDSGSFGTFLDLVREAGMEEMLGREGPYTLFVPDDDAFRAASGERLAAVRKDPGRLADILRYHMVAGVHSTVDLIGIRTLRSLQGEDLAVEVAPEGVLVNNVPVMESDAWCTNGICHAISALLLPRGAGVVAVPAGTGARENV
ncbi:fasciclin domain-containing protein [Methanoculleus sp. Wushi-C6]|uniref:Fasciclin domain-containing protein n=1 Tax=Methanoculleus caldifontis TaxID=2651577 RepID=A0ABU3X447_9EURY|nr:fasciclin domain-containing protein [Methanoculleus sp. Wushi-C6]MDV2482813.1 fasciclin domain-containing protein [Methanoculleus sp. Wushi-C6]